MERVTGQDGADGRPEQGASHDPVPVSVIHEWGLPNLTPEEIQQSFEATGRFNDEIIASGHWVFAGGLSRRQRHRRRRVTRAETVITDGPYLETKEQLGGFWVIEAADLDEALAIATPRLGGLPEPGRGPSLPGRVRHRACWRRPVPRGVILAERSPRSCVPSTAGWSRR